MGKKFQKNSINSKKFKNSIPFEIFTQHSAFELKSSDANSGSIIQQKPTPFDPQNFSCPPLTISCKFFNFLWSNQFFRPSIVVHFSPCGNRGFFHV